MWRLYTGGKSQNENERGSMTDALVRCSINHPSGVLFPRRRFMRVCINSS
jgi:hypothetical protein